jgi:ATP-dependent Zn protease
LDNNSVPPSLRQAADEILAGVGITLTGLNADELSGAVHDYRVALKRWRAQLRLRPSTPDPSFDHSRYGRSAAEATGREIDLAVHDLIEAGGACARTICAKSRGDLVAGVELLIAKETLTAEEFAPLRQRLRQKMRKWPHESRWSPNNS